MSEVCLIVMAKRPILGRVKTRLAQSLGDETALDVYRQLLDRVIVLVRNWEGAKYVHLAEGEPGDVDCSFAAAGAQVHEQTKGDLGARMQHAFFTAFEASPKQKCIMIGVDCPDIQPEMLQRAATLLDANDAVFGPASDGGYYLIGLSKLINDLFTNIPWSSSRVLSASLQVLRRENTQYGLLGELSDIDHVNDLNKTTWSPKLSDEVKMKLQLLCRQ